MVGYFLLLYILLFTPTRGPGRVVARIFFRGRGGGLKLDKFNFILEWAKIGERFCSLVPLPILKGRHILTVYLLDPSKGSEIFPLTLANAPER